VKSEKLKVKSGLPFSTLLALSTPTGFAVIVEYYLSFGWKNDKSS